MSDRAEREGDSFTSPRIQRERIEEACAREGFELAAVYEEIDVSGYRRGLATRPGLLQAVETVEAGHAGIVMVAYFDRLVRSLKVQGEVVSRVEAAGGRVIAVDAGEVSEATATQWLRGTTLGMVAEFYSRSLGERTRAAQADAVARGVLPWPKIPLGYRRREDGRLEPDPESADAVTEAWQLRAGGGSVANCRNLLRSRGVEYSYSAVTRMFGQRVYLGEIHFGQLTNLEAHKPLVDRAIFEAVQRVRLPRGRQPRSERLLARLGVLRCGGCGGAMGASMGGNGMGGTVPVYRCPQTTSRDCELRANISAPIAERVVSDATRAALADVEGRASAESEAIEAAERAERSQADLDAAIRTFRGLEDEPVALERLAELRAVRDRDREQAHRLSGLRSAVVIRADADWDRLTIGERRDLIAAVVDRAVVGPGRGAGRITVHLVGEDPAGGGVEDTLGTG